MSIDAVRTRLIWTMFGANALSSTAFIGAVTVAPIVAESLMGSATLAGLPSTAATVGTAAGALVLGSVGARAGRRLSFGTGFGFAALGAAGAAAAAVAESIVGFVASLFVLGFGRSAAQLARYAAGDLRTEDRRGRAISLVVWAATIGAVVGPLLIAPAGSRALAADLPEDVGPIILAAIGFGLASIGMFALLRPDPIQLAIADADDGPHAADPIDTPLSALFRRPSVRLSMAVLVTSQLVMVLVMTMTPLHIRGAGQELASVGWVMMAHTLGMFALAPITGAIVDRTGPTRTMAAGGLVLVASCVAAASAGGADTGRLVVSLFGLGYGWNLGFVAASTHLQHGLLVAERARLQGVADAATWVSGGVGAAISGFVVSAGSYVALAAAGAALSLAIPIALTLARRSTGATAKVP